MELKDKLMLQTWVRSRATLDEVERAARFGLVDNERFTEQARRAYRLLWTWSAWRLSSVWQEEAYTRLGPELFARRIARAQVWVDRVHEGRF